MFDNVVIGVDRRAGGDDAIALAEALAAPEASVALTHIYGTVTQPPGSGSALLEDQHLGAVEMLDGACDRCDPVRGTPDKICAIASSVGKGLHQVAEQRHADLLVVGSSHHGLAGKMLMGDDTRATFNGAPCAIAIAPHGYALRNGELDAIGVIGVGYDDRPEGRRALAAARALAQRTGATITAVWVVTHEDVRRQAPLPADWPSATTTILNNTEAALNRLDGVRGRAVYGGPREELTRLAQEVDLLVVGSRGYGPLGSVLHGSVSSYLERHATSPLLVLPRDLPHEPRPAQQPDDRTRTATRSV